MGIRRRINRKGLSQKPSTPNPDILQHFLQSRPFGDGKKVRSPQLPTSADIFRTRPFAPHKPQSAPPEEMPDVQTQLNSGEEFGYLGFNMPAFAPESALPIQAKLTIGEPNDPYEQEADAVAAQVVSQINSPPPQESAASQTVQREDMLKEDEEKPVQTSLEISTIQRDEMPAPEEEEEDKQSLQAKLESGTIQREEIPPPEEEEDKQPLQTKLESGTIQREEIPPPEEEEDKQPLQAKLMVQRKSGEGGTAATPDLENSIESAIGGGQSLNENIRKPMEQAFGADFSGVKVHTDGQSDQLNQSIQARAFTTGQDIFFRKGQYDPGSKGGQELLAHELTHVVQQNSGAVQRNTIQCSSLDDYNDPSNPQHDPGSLSEADIQATDEYQYLQQRFFPQQTPGPIAVQELVLACRLALRYIREHQVSLTEAYLETFLPQARRQLAVTSESDAMVGQQMTWIGSGPGSGNTFETWASASSEQAAPPISSLTTINCWEMILLAAYNAGMVSWQWIHNIYTAHKLDWYSYLVQVLSGSGRVPYQIGDPNTPRPLRGDIVFFDGAAHVALANGVIDSQGRTQIISFWPPPDTSFTLDTTTTPISVAPTLDKVKVTTIEELNQSWTQDYGQPAFNITFATAPW